MKVHLLASTLALLALHGFSPAKAADTEAKADAAQAGKQAENDDDDDDKPVAVADLPKAVADSATTAQAGGKITEADIENEDGVSVYSLNVVNNGKKYEVKVDASGKVVSNKLDDDDDDGDDENDGPEMKK